MSEARPRVLLNFAASIDGKITVAPALRQRPFTMSRHPEDHRRMRQLRASADAILIGAANLRVDDPDLALAADERERRQRAGERQPYRVVVTRRGDGVTPDRKMFDPSLGGPGVVVHSDQMPSSARERLAKVATLVSLGERDVDLSRMLEWLAVELRVGTVLCEGGGIICAGLFAARAVDELFVTLVPRILGGVDAPTLVEGAGFLADQIPDATLGAVDRVGHELYLRYDFRWA
jgi:2,5-diamino-6-(ribosylamino)-4(3H)-pyrimidinone 5'-phosphate reductase